MNLRFKPLLSLVFAVVAMTALSNCGKKDSNNSTPLTQTGCPTGYVYSGTQCIYSGTANTQCAVGQIYSNQYGCLTQGNCPAGQALYNNQCVSVGYTNYPQQGNCPYGTTYYNGQCMPMNGGWNNGGNWNYQFYYGQYPYQYYQQQPYYPPCFGVYCQYPYYRTY